MYTNILLAKILALNVQQAVLPIDVANKKRENT
jgi:hypothetical protein